VAILLALLAANCGPRDPTADVAGPQAPSPVATDGALTVCSFPSVKPTYLPWVPEGAPLPVPQEIRQEPELHQGQEPTPSYAIFMWSKTETQDRFFQVQLWATTPHGQGVSDEPVDVKLNGARGYLHSRSPNTAVIIWDIGAPECEMIHLILKAPPLPLREVKSEIIRIGESLRRT
jgi:hypothetical protein